MELEHVSMRKALALEAFHSQEYEEADRLYAELNDLYQRYEMNDGLVGIAFNRLLIALESADRAGIHRSMGRLARLLSEGAGSAAIFEVAERVCALFSTPVQGVDFEATTALLLIAQELVGQPRGEPDMSISASEIPAPTDLLSGNATETAVRVLRMAESLRGHPAMPSWLRPVLRLYDCQGGPGTRFNDSFEQYLEARGHSDSLRAYRALLKAQQYACEEHLPAAFEMLTGLALLEADGLPKKLAYAPNSPLESRCLLAAELFRTLAESLTPGRGTEPLVKLFNQEALHWVERAVGALDQRNETGHRRASDSERRARLAIVRAAVLRESGDFKVALATVSEWKGRAERGTFGDPHVAGRLLEEYALLQECLGVRGESADGYLCTVRAAIPGLLSASQVETRAASVHNVAVSVERLLAAVRGLCGLARGSFNGEAERYLDLAQEVIDFSGRYLRGDALALATAMRAITAAQCGSWSDAVVAVETARILGLPWVAGLGYMYWGEGLIARDPAAASEAISLFEKSFLCLAEVEPCAERHQVEMTLVAQCLQWGNDQDRARYEVHLRRSLEMDLDGWRSGALGWWRFAMPRQLDDQFAANVVRFIETDQVSLARSLCRFGRSVFERRSVGVQLPPSAGMSADLIADFYGCWHQVEGEFRPLAWRGLARPEPTRKPQERPSSRSWNQGVLELFSLLDHGVAFYEGRGQLSAAVLPRLNPGHAGAAAHEAWKAAVSDILPREVCVRLEGIDAVEAGWAMLSQASAAKGIGWWEWRDGVSVPTIAEDAPTVSAPRLAIVGDALTAGDIRLNELESSGAFSAVSALHGDHAVKSRLLDALVGYEVVCFVGDYGAASGLGVSDSEPNLALREVAQFCEQVGVKVLIFGGRPTGPLSSAAELIFQDFSGIVLLATAAADSSRGFLKEMLSESACRLTAGAVVASVGYAQRAMGGHGQGAPYRLFLSG